MIKANELRIGNWVKLVNEFVKVVVIRRHLIKHEDADGSEYPMYILPEAFEPIPLSPEILERCGFDEQKLFDLKDYWYKIITVGELELSFYMGTINIGKYQTKITHLHQLQNLYFALTGSELTIKNIVEV